MNYLKLLGIGIICVLLLAWIMEQQDKKERSRVFKQNIDREFQSWGLKRQ